MVFLTEAIYYQKSNILTHFLLKLGVQG
jgi:hypothetical protein